MARPPALPRVKQGREKYPLPLQAAKPHWHPVSSASAGRGGISIGDIQGEVGWPEEAYPVETAVVSVWSGSQQDANGISNWVSEESLKKDHLQRCGQC